MATGPVPGPLANGGAAAYSGRWRARLLNNAGLAQLRDQFLTALNDRQRSGNTNPLEPSTAPLDGGDSLIIFPEGTRNLDDEVKLLPFKSGIYHLSLAHPDVELVPVLANLNRVMPKGRMQPLPLLCTPELRQAAGRHGGRRQGGVPRTTRAWPC